MLWDVGTFEVLKDGDGEAQIARGDLKFRADGQKMKGEFALVLMKGRGKGNEWLLIKKARRIRGRELRHRIARL